MAMILSLSGSTGLNIDTIHFMGSLKKKQKKTGEHSTYYFIISTMYILSFVLRFCRKRTQTLNMKAKTKSDIQLGRRQRTSRPPQNTTENTIFVPFDCFCYHLCHHSAQQRLPEILK